MIEKTKPGKFCLLWLILFFALFPLYSQSNQEFGELERVAQAELKERNAAGCGVILIKHDKVVFLKGFGTANVETNLPVTPDTLFQIGSVTKTFTAAAILSLSAEGKLKLDTPIGAYAKGLNSKLAKVTLAQLLSHTAGIIDEPDEYGGQDESLMASYIRSWSEEYALFDAGEFFSYSNSGFSLAGFTAQEVYGKSYTTLMNEKVFQPLGMSRSTFSPTVAMTYPLAVGHTSKPNEKPKVVRPLPHDARLYPAGTMYSSLNDLSRFAIAFLNGGKLDGKQIISPAIINAMSTPRAKQVSAADETSYGYGLFINNYRGVRTVWHEGSMTGYLSFMLFAPQQNVGIIVLSNTNGVSMDKTQQKAMEMMLPLTAKAEPKPKPALPMTEAEMQKYVGVYDQPKRFKFEVFIKDKKLFVKEFGNEMPLEKIGEDRFAFKFPWADGREEVVIKPARDGKTMILNQYVWAFRRMNK